MQSIHWNQHSAHLKHSVSEFYRNSELTDCILDVEDKSIHVHKIIIATCSPYFKKLLKNDHAISLIPIKDVTYKDMKLILDFIYYGEVDVHVTDVTSLMKTAEILEMTSLKHNVSHCFQKELSCKHTSARSVYERCSMSRTNVIRHETKNLLEDQVSHDPTVLYTREERLGFKSKSIHVHATNDSSTKYLNDFQGISEKWNKNESKISAPNSCDGFKKNTKQDTENVNEELVPLAFVAVSEIQEPNEEDQDEGMCVDLASRDPLGEYPGTILDVTEERSVERECTLESELQVKEEPKDENDIPESMTDDVLISDESAHSFHELPSTKCYLIESCDQESGMDMNQDVILSDKFCSEGCASEKTHDLERKFEPICGINRVGVEDKRVYETAQCFNHIVGDNTETTFLEPKSELFNCGVQHFASTDYQHDVNEKDCEASTSKISNLFALEIGNNTPAIHIPAYTEIEHSEGRKKSKKNLGNKSSLIPHSIIKKQNKNQHLVPKESSYLVPLDVRDHHELTGNVPTHSIQKRNYSCKKSLSQSCSLNNDLGSHSGDEPFQSEIFQSPFCREVILKRHMQVNCGDNPFQCQICRKSFRDKNNLQRHLRIHSGEKPYQCVICKSSFTQGSHLKSHLQVHSAEKPFQCDVCRKSFRDRSNYKCHMRVHSGDKPFQCEICKSSFSRGSSLKNHLRVHSGDKPFQCGICKSAFSERSSLKRHMRVHSGGKQF